MKIRPLIATFVLPFAAQLFSSEAIAANAISMSAVSGARFEVFVSVPGNQGGVYHTWQLADQKSWQPSWQQYLPAPDENGHGLVAGRDGSGRIVVAWISDGYIHFAQAIHADASLLNSNDLTIKPVIDPFDHKNYKFKYLAIAKNPDGKIEILALSENGRVYSIKQKSLVDDGSPWMGKMNGPNLVGGGELQNISVTNLRDGLALVGTGKDGKVYVKNQTDSGTWDNDPWTNLGGNQVQDVRAKESRDHQLEIVALGADKKIYLQFQNVGASTFSGWQILLGRGSDEKFGPTFFFDRFKDGTLFVTTHFDYDDSSQYKGTFAKAFQSPNNGSWPGTLFRYNAARTVGTSTINPDDLGFLSANAFALAADVNGNINYFACYRNSSQVEHYVDKSGASSASSTGFLTYQGAENLMPNLP
jgi:hypothetical protein